MIAVLVGKTRARQKGSLSRSWRARYSSSSSTTSSVRSVAVDVASELAVWAGSWAQVLEIKPIVVAERTDHSPPQTLYERHRVEQPAAAKSASGASVGDRSSVRDLAISFVAGRGPQSPVRQVSTSEHLI